MRVDNRVVSAIGAVCLCIYTAFVYYCGKKHGRNERAKEIDLLLKNAYKIISEILDLQEVEDKKLKNLTLDLLKLDVSLLKEKAERDTLQAMIKQAQDKLQGFRVIGRNNYTGAVYYEWQEPTSDHSSDSKFDR